MKIGILVSFNNNFGEKGFYNAQEYGLAKSLKSFGHQIVVYRYGVAEKVESEDNITTKIYVACTVGSNAIVDTRVLDIDLDALVYFADIQLSVPSVFSWCVKNSVVFIPYIGVIKSNSENPVNRLIMGLSAARNQRIYRGCRCMVKNENVLKALKEKGVQNVSFAPVGIDLDLVNKEYGLQDRNDLKRKYGFRSQDKVMLFIGRLEKEKEPVNLIQHFHKIYQADQDYRLFIVGKGVLYDSVMKEIETLGLQEAVKYKNKIPNSEIWELYRLCDCFVNLNKREIFGMVLLEAMYYETKLVAWHAPGPDYIVENGVSGYLVSSEQEFLDAILMKGDPLIGKNAHERAVNELTWDKTASIVIDLIKNSEC